MYLFLQCTGSEVTRSLVLLICAKYLHVWFQSCLKCMKKLVHVFFLLLFFFTSISRYSSLKRIMSFYNVLAQAQNIRLLQGNENSNYFCIFNFLKSVAMLKLFNLYFIWLHLIWFKNRTINYNPKLFVELVANWYIFWLFHAIFFIIIVYFLSASLCISFIEMK